MVLQVKQNVTHIQAVSKLKSWNDEGNHSYYVCNWKSYQ